MEKQMELFSEGGLRDEGGETEPKSGNRVPSGSLKEEVADDIPVMISEGEFVFPADVVRYIGLNTLMKMRQDAKQGLKMMEKMGQMGNSEEAEIPDDIPFGMADLIVVSGEMKKEDKEKKAEGGVIGLANGGSLFDDPRFQRPKGGGTPVLDDEEKKEIEDALIGTVYGNITVRRYVNADGVVKYIPFIDDEPQMPIPEGFELDNTAPKPKSSIVTSTGDTGGGEDSGGAAFTPDVGSSFDNQGTTSFNINNLNNEELVEYYGSFSSPMNRFLTVGVGALFGGLPALGIATMQQLGQTRGPNSLVAVENLIAQKISNGEISGDLLDKLKEYQKRAKQKGTGPNSFISKLIGGVSEGDNQKADTLTKALKAGDVNTVNKELEGAVEQSVQQALKDALFTLSDDISPDEIQGNTTLINTVGGLVDIAPTTTFESMRDKRSEEAADRTAAMSDFTRQVPSAVTPIRTDDITTEDALAKATGTEAYRTAFGLENFGRTPIEGTRFEVGRSPYEAEGRSQLGSGFGTTRPELYGRGFTPEDIGIDPALEQEFKDQVGGKTKKRTRRVDQPSRILPRRGEKFTDIGTDMPSRIGQTRVDDFLLGVQRDDKGNVANLSEQQQKNIRQNVQDVRKADKVRQDTFMRTGDAFAADQAFHESFTGFDSAGNFTGATDPGTQAMQSVPSFGASNVYKEGGLSKMYVGGVPTKPMKPQRLKKGGLAKPKVKPKRMKKGGLASKKK